MAGSPPENDLHLPSAPLGAHSGADSVSRIRSHPSTLRLGSICPKAAVRALRVGIRYAEGRGAVEFEPTDSASDQALYVYRLLVHDKIITPMPEDQVGEKTVRFRV